MIGSTECLAAYSDATLRAVWSNSKCKKSVVADEHTSCPITVNGNVLDNAQLSTECLIDTALLISHAIKENVDTEGQAHIQKNTRRTLVGTADKLLSFLVIRLQGVVSYFSAQLLVLWLIM